MNTGVADALLTSVLEETGIHLIGESWRSVGGGDINRAGQMADDQNRRWFIKLNDPQRSDMFVAEAAGLAELAAAAGISVPAVAGTGAADDCAWLLLEWLELADGTAADAALGQALAGMHRIAAGQFGWQRDNYIGTTAQPNNWSDSWPAFFASQRLGYQLRLAEQNSVPIRIIDMGAELQERVGDWFVDYQPAPSLLHGDLWAGNKGALRAGGPALFDPAVYYGDREADIAMTRLFGGFSAAFYNAYESTWPLDQGVAGRQDLYNLYHVLNHFNLFGGGYAAQAEHILQKLLSA